MVCHIEQIATKGMITTMYKYIQMWKIISQNLKASRIPGDL